MKSHKAIAEGILGYAIDEEGYAPCPGAAFHTTASGARDWKIWFDGEGKPHEHCFHSSCQAMRDDFMRSLYRAISAEERGGRSTRRIAAPGRQPLPQAPQPRKVKAAKELDFEMIDVLASRVDEEISPEWLRDRSPVKIPQNPALCGELMLKTLYPIESKILVFTAFASQGQYLYEVGKGVSKLGRKPGIPAIPAPRLPNGGNEGVWFLTAPVSGEWMPNPSKRDNKGNMIAGRRHSACCCGFPYLVLESDNLSPDKWLKILVQLSDPIAAIYTSGGKSIHALVRVLADTPEEFNVYRDEFIMRLSAIGADSAAITPVRLSRLPGCLRHGTKGANGEYIKYDSPRKQELLFLNPAPRSGTPILTMPSRRAQQEGKK